MLCGWRCDNGCSYLAHKPYNLAFITLTPSGLRLVSSLRGTYYMHWYRPHYYVRVLRFNFTTVQKPVNTEVLGDTCEDQYD